VSLLQRVLDWHLFELGGTPVTVITLVTALILVLVSYGLSHLIQRVLGRAMRRRQLADLGTVHVAQRLLHYTIMLVGVGVALDTMGIELGALFAAGAIFAVGLGFAMQNIAQNFVAGVILLIERSIKPNDVLEVEGLVVRVVQMGIRATLARTRDEEELIIPNGVLVQSTVKNYTLRDSLYRLRAQVGVVYGSDMAQVAQTLKAMADKLTWRRVEKDPLVLIIGFGDSSVNFEVSVWIDDPWSARPYMSKLNDAIWWALKDNDIVIAFPQLDVHFDPPIHDTVAQLGHLVPARR